MASLIAIGIWFIGALRLLILPISGICWFLVLYTLTPRYLGIGVGDVGLALSGKRLLVITTFAVALFSYLKSTQSQKAQARANTATFLFLVMVTFLTGFMASLLNGDSLVSYLRFTEDFILLITAALIGVLFARFSYGSRVLSMYAFVIPLVFAFFLVVLEILKGAPLLSGIIEANSAIAIGEGGREFTDVKIRDSMYRAKGLFDGQLMLAEFVVYTLPAIFYAHRIRRLSNLSATILVLCAVFILWSTGSRGGLVVFFLVFLFFIFCLSLKNSRKVVRMFVPAITVLSICTVLLVLYQMVSGLEIVDNFSVIDDRSERSTYGRLLQYQIVGNIVSESPIYGFGYKRNISDAFEQIYTIDNFYLALLIQSGSIGLIAFVLAIVYTSVVVFFRSTGKGDAEYYFGIWILGFLIAFAAMKLFLTQYSNNFYFFLMASYALNRLGVSRKNL